MTSHITVRLAWHDDGWNGRVCKEPQKNIHCVGCHSYPGEMIREQRDIEWEKNVAGQKFSSLDRIPACMYSGSAFSDDVSKASAAPPSFFNDDSQPVEWDMPEATACTWPYDVMFNGEGIKKNGKYDNTQRFIHAQAHFDKVECAKSLVFYYANYSNPFTTEEKSQYVLVGISRVKSIGEPRYYLNCSEETKQRYHNGYVWQREVTNCYPEQGIRLPYHLYKDDFETANKFVVVPEQSQVCKYGSRLVSDDEALGLLEQFLNSLRVLKDEIQDTSENWQARIIWLETLISELWVSRGCYPGMTSVLEYLSLHDVIDRYKNLVHQDKEQEAYQSVCDFLNEKTNSLCGQAYDNLDARASRRNALLTAEGESLDFLLTVVARLAVTKEQITNVLNEERQKWGITASLPELTANPYILAEQYQGIDESDTIGWSLVDRGMVPSPDLSVKPFFDLQAEQRMRALLLETIRRSKPHVFVKAEQVLEQTNIRLDYLPEWKRVEVKSSYLSIDKTFYQQAITYREEGKIRYLYDRLLAEDESLLRDTFTSLLTRNEIKLKTPITKRNWIDQLKDESSALFKEDQSRDNYIQAINSQADVCIDVFTKPIAILAGGAGTGKSTVATAYINGAKQADGQGAAICVLAPTGKAADRLRTELQDKKITSGVNVCTIHSLLATNYWLNPNMTTKRAGGRSIESYSTIVIDECSMIDTMLFASFVRAVNWHCVTRILLVGDPAQLPPIGYGKVYADFVSYLTENYPNNIAHLTVNLRQMNNRVMDLGTGILDVASLFINQSAKTKSTSSCDVKEAKLDRDELLIKLQDGGRIDKDLRVEYWNENQPISEKLIELVSQDFGKESEAGQATWQRVLKDDVVAFQILSPVRGEEFGTEAINLACQSFKSGNWAQRGTVDGFHVFDKVIQVRNRTKSDPVKAYDFKQRKQVDLQIFNGEIGTLQPRANQYRYLNWKEYTFRDLCGKLVGKEDLSINYFGRTKDSPESNLELAYAISVHKSQGSEFKHVYFVIPKAATNRRLMELLYTGITRANRHCTLLIEGDVSSLIDHARPEKSALEVINSSLFDFNVVPDELLEVTGWYESGKVHKSLIGEMLRSKSEVIVADLLFKHDLQPYYEKPLKGKDDSQYLPDFTIQYQGETYYWEHLGMLEKPDYLAKWESKQQWYVDNGFAEQLIISRDRKGAIDSSEIDMLIKEKILGLDLSEMKKSWDEIIELSDDAVIIEFAKKAIEKDLALPVWGYEITLDDEVVGELEFAWLDTKVAIYTENGLSEENAEQLESEGWHTLDFSTFKVKKLVNVISAMIC
ncbi:AAA family ATPase [Photobacterium swingsii]|uniref:AAA family ATPase n=1 Tax=Photobacterium swingsii TaxID=680026 RepID=UPI00352E52B9